MQPHQIDDRYTGIHRNCGEQRNHSDLLPGIPST
jgi:hypothetical protein